MSQSSLIREPDSGGFSGLSRGQIRYVSQKLSINGVCDLILLRHKLITNGAKDGLSERYHRVFRYSRC